MPPEKLAHADDLFFKESLDRKIIALGLMRQFLPEMIRPELLYSSLKIIKNDWVDTELFAHFADILYEVSLPQKETPLFVLFEHKSYPDRMVHFQNLRYIVKIWEEYRGQNEGSDIKFPVVVPLVIYHGRRRWKGGNSMSLLCEIFKGTRDFIPDYNDIVVNLGEIGDEQISGDIQTRAFLLALKYSKTGGILQKLALIIDLFKNADEVQLEYLSVVLLYLGHVIGKAKRKEFLEAVRAHAPEGEVYMKTIADALSEQAWKKGLKEGKKIGMEKGMQAGEEKGMEKVALNLISMGMDNETVNQATGLSISNIEQLRRSLEK
ncbi:Transposase [Chitinispirillum alkaliphilum]|nr:Transposase [Chitinispirillum alkaliphilum]